LTYRIVNEELRVDFTVDKVEKEKFKGILDAPRIRMN